jgi:putative transcriptional regulator
MTKTLHYTGCGLDNIYLMNGWSVDETGALHIQNMRDLHKVIGQSLVFLNRKLKGKEIRYVRHYLDLSQKSFGERIGVDYQSVLRWETGKGKITKPVDRFLKALFHEYLNENARVVDIIDQISDADNDRRIEKVDLTFGKQGWKSAA